MTEEERKLRDQFAMAALIGMKACPTNYDMYPHEFAEAAYAAADAMIATRRKPSEV